jgi:hypothetical protein
MVKTPVAGAPTYPFAGGVYPCVTFILYVGYAVVETSVRDKLFGKGVGVAGTNFFNTAFRKPKLSVTDNAASRDAPPIKLTDTDGVPVVTADPIVAPAGPT